MSILRLDRVDFSYSGTPVLRGLCLELGEGSLSAVLGPNGAGKTTLVDICLGWKKPENGGVFVEGTPVSQLGGRQRGTVMSLVPQRENIRFDFTVSDYVLLGRAPHLPPLALPGESDRRVARAVMESAGITHLADRPVPTLSGGEYQLMLIARSLAQQPKLLLMDEPASQLDPPNRAMVVRMLKRLKSSGIAVLYTSHDPQIAAIADCVYLLKDGAFRFSGPPREVLTPETLEAVYGARFQVTWIGDSPHVAWE